MAESLDLFDFQLTNDEVTRIAALAPARPCSSTTTNPPWSSGSAGAASTKSLLNKGSGAAGAADGCRGVAC